MWGLYNLFMRRKAADKASAFPQDRTLHGRWSVGLSRSRSRFRPETHNKGSVWLRKYFGNTHFNAHAVTSKYSAMLLVRFVFTNNKTKSSGDSYIGDIEVKQRLHWFSFSFWYSLPQDTSILGHVILWHMLQLQTLDSLLEQR